MNVVNYCKLRNNLIDLIGMLLVSRSEFGEDNAAVLFFLIVKFQVFSGKQCNIPISFPNLRAVGQLVVHLLQA